MDATITLPGRGSTAFYFTALGKDGFSEKQCRYIMELVHSYRMRFPRLEITGVWDFGREEGTPYAGEKYGDFASCRDNAVFNNIAFTISLNHIRLSKMPQENPPEELARIGSMHEQIGRLSDAARGLQEKLMNCGTPPRVIQEEIRKLAGEMLGEDAADPAACTCSGPAGAAESGGLSAATGGQAAGLPAAGSGSPVIDPGPHNHLLLTDPLFADVWAIRQLEESRSIKRIIVHELGHALSEKYGILGDRRVRKLFAGCRDGFEDLDEFCAECFMASELMPSIPLANSLAAFIQTCL